MILVARYDTIKQLEEINLKTDTILSDLRYIKAQLGIVDTTKLKRK